MKWAKILICGFCKSGTTIITKTFAHCVGLNWQNEIKCLWGISDYADIDTFPNDSIAETVLTNGQWNDAQKIIAVHPIVKFPDWILLLNLFPKTMKVICVIINPVDAICAYLERKHEFKTTIFSD